MPESLWKTVKQTVESIDTKAGRVFDLTIQALIVLSLITFAVETLPGISPLGQQILRIVEIIIVLIFTAEYILRVLVADRRFRFIFSFYGIVDIAAILPFYLSTGIDLRSIRVIRLLRLFRIMKLGRYSLALKRVKEAFRLAREELILFLSASAVILYIASVGIYFFENSAQPDKFSSVFHSMWWALATLTTVGYGDIYPITVGGRVFTAFVLVVGLGIVAVPAGIVASALSQTRAEQQND